MSERFRLSDDRRLLFRAVQEQTEQVQATGDRSRFRRSEHRRSTGQGEGQALGCDQDQELRFVFGSHQSGFATKNTRVSVQVHRYLAQAARRQGETESRSDRSTGRVRNTEELLFHLHVLRCNQIRQTNLYDLPGARSAARSVVQKSPPIRLLLSDQILFELWPAYQGEKLPENEQFVDQKSSQKSSKVPVDGDLFDQDCGMRIQATRRRGDRTGDR